MQVKLPLGVRVVLIFVICGLFCFFLFSNRLDFLYPVLIYLIDLPIAIAVCGLSYDILPGKKAIEATKEATKYTNVTQPGGTSLKQRAIGYWAWFACCLGAGLILTIVYHFQLAGYF